MYKALDLDKAKDLMYKLLLSADMLHQNAKTLSGGEAARFVFIRALLLNPVVLLLDEPTASLDEHARHVFYEVLKTWLALPGHACIIISHNEDYRELENYSILKLISAGQGV